MNSRGRVLLSLHDVTPFHLDRLKKAEALLASAGVARVTYLLVPRFHGMCAIEHDRRFIAWCHAARPFVIDWFLHGFFHSEEVEPAIGRRPRGIATRLRARLMTAREAEFLALRGEQLRGRLAQGIDAFRAVLGTRPAGFVAPAWLLNDDLLPALQQAGVRVTEDKHAIHDLGTGRRLRCPVITWATRTPLRKHASRLAAPLLLRLWTRAPSIRIALHPHDFDYPATLRSIERVVRSALRTREPAWYP